jgi:hypothetical protein
MFLFDVAPPIPSGAGAIIVGVIFFFIALASGAFAFVMLRKTVKMAIRMFIVAAVLIIAVVGSIALYMFLKPVPEPYKRPTRPSERTVR